MSSVLPWAAQTSEGVPSSVLQGETAYLKEQIERLSEANSRLREENRALQDFGVKLRQDVRDALMQVDMTPPIEALLRERLQAHEVEHGNSQARVRDMAAGLLDSVQSGPYLVRGLLGTDEVTHTAEAVVVEQAADLLNESVRYRPPAFAAAPAARDDYWDQYGQVYSET